MSEKIWNDIEVDFLNKIYNYKGAVGVNDLFHMLKSSYGLKVDLFNKILGMVTQKEYCIIEKIRKLDNTEEEVIFVTYKGLQSSSRQLTECEMISLMMQKILHLYLISLREISERFLKRQ